MQQAKLNRDSGDRITIAPPPPPVPRDQVERMDQVRLTDCPIIGLTGAAGSGKDTIADYFAAKYNAAKLPLADPIKAGLQAMLGIEMASWSDREWKENVLPEFGCSPRQLAQTLGTEWGRVMCGEDVWVQRILSIWQQHNRPFMVISDVRFDNEAKAIRDLGGMIFQVNRKAVEPVADHVSEEGIDPALITGFIYNNGTFDELYAEAEAAIIRTVRAMAA